MTVTMIAITPSLNASTRLVLIFPFDMGSYLSRWSLVLTENRTLLTSHRSELTSQRPNDSWGFSRLMLLRSELA